MEQVELQEVLIGRVVHFFPRPSAAAIELTNGELRLGDKIRIRGHTTDFIQVVTSMQVENQPVEVGVVGQTIGVKVNERVREGDLVYKLVGGEPQS
ncbi:MAG: hypothetical protein RMK18_07140 [Armatimonadota bacterium]|nr:hypothetical protein [Armatimonadota bacterium]MCX7777943.1 hypothetical protein [Armatimonadota bacterium]MDW8025624.1 hypothetical protein [Armatimonadota bacterium]